MAQLVWDDYATRVYETGVDRGVLYLEDGTGIAWSGLISVNRNLGISAEPVYFDGRKVNDLVNPGNVSLTIRAFTYPDEFDAYQGVFEDATGLLITGQEPKRFHLAYRTLVGDFNGDVVGYQIHLFYNLTAIPSNTNFKTLSLDPEPTEFSWTVSSLPSNIAGYRPTAYIIVDSRKIPSWFLSDIEEVLYGSDTRTPMLPELEGFITFFRKYDRIIILDNGDGTWTASTDREGAITDLGDGEFQIISENATFLTADKYEISSTPTQDEDLWQP